MTMVQQYGSSARTAGMAVARKGGFTLIELLAVMAIISMLVALIVGAGVFARRAGMRATAKAQMQQIQTALQEYKLQNGTYPGNLEDASIVAWLKTTTTKFNITNNIIMDPWSHPYAYIGQPESYTLFSLGEKADLSFKADDIYPGR